MPEYDYKCKECGNKTTLRHSMSETGEEHYCECGAILTRIFIPIKINSRQPIAGHGMEIYTNEADAIAQMSEQITISED